MNQLTRQRFVSQGISVIFNVALALLKVKHVSTISEFN